MRNILAVITARGGSKGLPGKNIKILGDKPLLAYTILSAQKSTFITDLILSTDDEGIAAVGREWGVEVPFMRPPELSNDTAGHLEVMRHAVSFMEKKKGIHYDFVVILQPTSPFRLPEDIDITLQKLIDTKADSAVSMVELETSAHPVKAKKMDGERVLPYCIEEKSGIRRQDLPIAYKRSGAVYAMRRELLMVQNELYGRDIVGHIVPKDRSIDIDDRFDWIKAEYMLAELQGRGLYVSDSNRV